MKAESELSIDFDVQAWIDFEQKRWNNASKEMANDILIRAKMNAPVDSGKLVASGRVEKQANGTYEVVFGNSSVRYAAIRERRNRKNPSTVKYLEKAAESVKKGNTSKYFR